MATYDRDRYDRWRRRESLGNLSFWGELWVEPESLPEYADWRALAERRGWANVNAKHSLTRTLLGEVLYAAGGVETELLRLNRAIEEAQHWTDEVYRTNPPSGEALQTFSGAPSLADGFYAFINLLSWARAVEERTDRAYRPGQRSRTGLLPALARGELHDRVVDALQQLKRNLRETRWLANFALHAGPLPGGGTPTALVGEGGKILIRMPNSLRGPIATWEEFSYTEGRDMRTFAHEVFADVEGFVEEVLAAFETARPERAGPLPGFL